MTAVLLFTATFSLVFALGLQSLNVNGGHRMLAALTSFGIGSAQLLLFKTLPGPTTDLDIAAYLAGGPLGILASMWAHPWIVSLRRGQIIPDERLYRPLPPTSTLTHELAYEQLVELARELVSPDGYGYSVPAEVRDHASQILALLKPSEPTPSRKPLKGNK